MPAPEPDHDPEPQDEPQHHGGDDVCWLDRVCEDCGALQDGPPPPRCPRCGADRSGAP